MAQPGEAKLTGGKGKPPLLAPFTQPAAPAIPIKRVALIYNPFSGGKKGQKLVDTVVLPAFKEAGVEVATMPTERAGHGATLGETCELAGVDALCAFGGDGTLSEVLNGFMRRDPQPPIALGFLPGGTGNTFLHDVMGCKQRGAGAVRTAIATICAGRTRKIDVGKMEFFESDGSTPLTRYSLNIVTAGLGVDINKCAETRRFMGAARYPVTQTLEVLKLGLGRRMPPCTLTVDGAAHQFGCFVICVMCNKHSGASMRVSPAAQLDDGQLDVMYVEQKVSVPKALKLDGMIKGGGKHVNDPLVTYERASQSVELKADEPLTLMVDGDILGVTPLKLEVLPKAFTLLTPEEPAAS